MDGVELLHRFDSKRRGIRRRLLRHLQPLGQPDHNRGVHCKLSPIITVHLFFQVAFTNMFINRLKRSSSSPPPSPLHPFTLSSLASSRLRSRRTTSRPRWASKCFLLSGSPLHLAWLRVSSGCSASAAAAASLRTRRSASRRHRTHTSVLRVPHSLRTDSTRAMLEVRDMHRPAPHTSHLGRRVLKSVHGAMSRRHGCVGVGNR
jgi:hypothetical protein